MSNILYIGPYREFSGMGNSSRQYIKALLLAGHNIGIRPIYNILKEYPEKDIDSEILKLEKNVAKPYDILIQHCCPHQLCYDNRFQKNIAIINLESDNYFSNIDTHLGLVDHIIVGSDTVNKCLSKHTKTPISIIPEPIDLELINEYKNKNQKKKKLDTYTFYTIADMSDRKNILDIVKAFSLAYDDNDDVDLVLKLRNTEQDRTDSDQTIEYEFNKIYRILKKNYFKKPKIIFGDVDYQSIMYLHHNNDCFINVSSGESFGYSTLEAMAFNNNLIVNSNIGSTDLVDGYCGLINNTIKVPCEENNRQFFLYNSYHQTWVKPDIQHLILNMTIARNESVEKKEQRIKNQQDKLQKFNTQHTAELLRLL